MSSPQSPKPTRPTVQDVAIRAGVSTATVSRVLNRVGSVDPALVERVRSACEALQYRPNSAARALAGGRSALIGLLVSDIQNPFFLELLRGVEDTIQQHDYLLVLANTMENPARERQYIKVMCAEAVAGAIVVPTTDRTSILQPFVEAGVPVVAVDRRVRDRSIDTVLLDNMAAAREAVTHLIANGYRRIAMITGPERTTTARERLTGYRQALRDAGIAPAPALERRGAFTAETGRERTTELLTLEPPIDAIIAGNNRLTMGTLQAIHEHGLRIPEDIGVVSFDHVPWISPGSVSLTMVTQPAYDLGATAAQRLVQHLQQARPLARQEIVLAHRMVIGESSQPRKAGRQTPSEIPACP